LTNRFADHYGGFLIVKGFCRSKVFVKGGVFSGAKFAVFTKFFLACFLARGGLQIPCQKNNIKLLKIYYNYILLLLPIFILIWLIWLLLFIWTYLVYTTYLGKKKSAAPERKDAAP